MCTYSAYHGPTSPENVLSNGDVRVILHVDSSWALPWRFIKHKDRGYVMLPKVPSVQPEAGRYLTVPDDIVQRDCGSKFVSVTADADRATCVIVELP